MRIIHIGNVNREANGVGQVIKELSEAQRKIGHDIITLTARHKQDELPSFVEVHTKKDFIKLLDSFKPDIFLFHSLYIWEYIKFYPILRKRNIPFLIQLHGALSKENYRKSHLKKVIANKLFYNKFLKNAKRIIYLNEGELRESLVKYINSNTAIVPNGSHSPQIIPKLRSNDTRKVEFLFLGRIDIYHKGLDMLVKVIEELNKKGYSDRIHFTFYGIGFEEDLLKFKEMLEPLKNLAEFKGPAYGKEKEKAYQNSDYFILTSRFEGMPMSILESLSYGRPCLVTPATNVGDIIAKYECGYVSKLEVETLVRDIIKASNEYDSKKEVLFKNSIKAAEDYNWTEIAKITIALYTNVLNENAQL